MARRHGLLVVNPASGQGRARRGADRVAGWLDEFGLHVEVVTTRSPEDATALGQRAAAGGGWERVVVCGGDGTVSSLAAGLVGSAVPMAVIPAGTANCLARELEIPRSLREACRVAATGGLRRIDVGLANGRPFALMAGVGFDGEVVRRIGPQVKDLLGAFGYVVTGLRVLAEFRPARMTLATQEGQAELSAWLVVVSNAATYAHYWHLTPEASFEDGWLDVCVFAESDLPGSLGQLAGALSGHHLEHPQVRHLRTREIRIEADPTVSVQLDGDPAGATPVAITIRPRALSVIVPPESAEEGLTGRA